MEDVFGDEDDMHIGNMSYRRMTESVFKDGFREGVTEGQERFVQQGFNTGFISTAEMAFKLAELRGRISAILGHHMIAGGTTSEESVNELKVIIESIGELETSWISSQDTVLSDSSAVNMGKGACCKTSEGQKDPDTDGQCCGGGNTDSEGSCSRATTNNVSNVIDTPDIVPKNDVSAQIIHVEKRLHELLLKESMGFLIDG